MLSRITAIAFFIQSLIIANAVHDSMNFVLKPLHRECNTYLITTALYDVVTVPIKFLNIKMTPINVMM